MPCLSSTLNLPIRRKAMIIVCFQVLIPCTWVFKIYIFQNEWFICMLNKTQFFYAEHINFVDSGRPVLLCQSPFEVHKSLSIHSGDILVELWIGNIKWHHNHRLHNKLLQNRQIHGIKYLMLLVLRYPRIWLVVFGGQYICLLLGFWNHTC